MGQPSGERYDTDKIKCYVKRYDTAKVITKVIAKIIVKVIDVKLGGKILFTKCSLKFEVKIKS